MAEIVIPFGKDGVLFYGTAGSCPNDVDNQLAAARDVTVTIDKEEGDASRRANPGWTDAREGMKTLRLSFDLVLVMDDPTAGTEDAGINVIRQAFLLGTHNGEPGIALYAKQTSLAVADTNYGGMWGDFIITGFTMNQPLKDIQTISVEAKATLIHGNSPAWVSSIPA